MKKYFLDSYDRPRDFAENPFPLNTKYENISSELLDALINHVKILKAYALGANRWQSEIHGLPNISRLTAEGTQYIETISTYEQLFNWLTKVPDGSFSHPQLHLFQQDVLILAHASSNADTYWFFWYAMSGRCDIGRFQTSDTQDQVLENFSLYVESVTFPEYDKAKEIPLNFFKQGWISF